MKRDNARSPSRTDPAWAPSCASTSFSMPFRLSSFAWHASRAACCAARATPTRLQLDALLGLADGARDPGVGDDFPFLGAGAVHPAGDAVGPEQPHQIVFEGQEEHTLSGIALAAGAATQLPVDAARFVPLGADDHEPARWVVVAAELLDLGLRP